MHYNGEERREPGSDSKHTNRARFPASIILSVEQYRQLHPIIIQHYCHYLNHDAAYNASRGPILRIRVRRYKSVARNAAHAVSINHGLDRKSVFDPRHAPFYLCSLLSFLFSLSLSSVYRDNEVLPVVGTNEGILCDPSMDSKQRRD